MVTRRNFRFNRRGSAATAAVVLIGIVVVGLLFGGSIMSYGSTFLSQINQGISDLFNSVGKGLGLNLTSSPAPSGSAGPSPSVSPFASSTPGAGGTISASAWFAFTLYFQDGSTQDLNMNPTFSLFPMSISWNGKDVSRMEVFLRLKVSGSDSGVVSLPAWSTSSSVKLEVYFNGASTPATGSTASYGTESNGWPNGQTESIQTVDVSAATLDQIFGAYGTGSWVFQVTGSVLLNIGGGQYAATMGTGSVTLANSGTLSVCSLTATHLPVTQLHRVG